jgi:hypothetical protein
MSEELNTKLEELLDAELTEDEVTKMEEEIQKLDEVEEVGGVAKIKQTGSAAKKPSAGGGEKSELTDESDDLAKEVTDPSDAASIGKAAASKMSPAKKTNPGNGSEAKVSQGSSATATPGDSMKLAAGDEVDHDGEQLEEARMTKAKMLEDLKAQIEELGKLNKADLSMVHEKINAAMKGEAELEETKVDAELKELEAQKKEIEERMKKISVKEDVEALIEGEELSEEFKDKAATIFEAAVKSKVKTEIERLEEEYAERLESDVAQAVSETSDKVDSYLAYVVEEWMKHNEVAVEHKLKTEITENFITGLKGLFEEHHITVPEEQFDILDAAAKQADEMEAKLNEQTEKNIELSTRVAELEQQEILVDVASDLADTEVEKFVGLAESVGYEGSEDYRGKLNTIKESYFQRTVKEDEVEAAPVYNELGDVSSQMAAYMTAIGKQEKRAQK